MDVYLEQAQSWTLKEIKDLNVRGPTGHQESRCSERFPKQLEPKSRAQKEKQNTTHFANIKIQDFCLLKNSIGKNTFYSNLRRNMNEYIKNF